MSIRLFVGKLSNVAMKSPHCNVEASKEYLK